MSIYVHQRIMDELLECIRPLRSHWLAEVSDGSTKRNRLDCTGFAGHVEKTYNEVKGRVRNYEREQISQKV